MIRQGSRKAEVAFSESDERDDYTPQQVAQLLAAGGVQLIDVRQADEHEAGRIAGSRLIQLGDLSGQADEPIERDTPVIFYCRSGARSAMATEAFIKAGYDAHNMSGGMLSSGRPGRPTDGTGRRGHVA